MARSRSDDAVALMEGSPLFRGLEREDLAALASIGLPKTLGKGEVLFVEGSQSRGFFLVLSGGVKLFKMSPAGKEQILHVHPPGEIFAEGTLFEGATYPASASATEDSRVLLFLRADFQRLLAKRPAVATNLIARLSQRLRQMAALVEDLSLREAPSRLARYLIDLAGDEAMPGTVVRLGIKKGELASLLGTRGETLSRLFRRLGEASVIRVQGSEVTILDPERLEDLAAGETDVI
jgi:CRP/FNR family transcriptional regulator